MPLRDHFRPPTDLRASWDSLFGMWPSEILRLLRTTLPNGYVAAPTVHLGSQIEESRVSCTNNEDVFEIRIYDAKRGRQLVAAIELVSPANKDRAEHRFAFVSKCVSLLKQGVAVSIIDVVTTRQANLYTELLQFLNQRDDTFSEQATDLYAVSCRWHPQDDKMILQTWPFPLVIGNPLPILPLWISPRRAIPLNLEDCYEQACHNLWIT